MACSTQVVLCAGALNSTQALPWASVVSMGRHSAVFTAFSRTATLSSCRFAAASVFLYFRTTMFSASIMSPDASIESNALFAMAIRGLMPPMLNE